MRTEPGLAQDPYRSLGWAGNHCCHRSKRARPCLAQSRPRRPAVTARLAIVVDIGAGPRGQRLVIPFKGGRFEGPKLRGEVLVTGGDWLLHRADGVFELDVRRTLRTDDGHHIYAAYRGILTGSAESLGRMGRGEAVPAADLYFRTTPVFETGSEKYAWLNRIVTVGIGAITA
ncbi:MAG: DUF3237 domain-containing protein, partial [Rhodomicrobium sp.]|nr:DUF3237 domain-containing protein [Rhodomicrobium sp.]